MLMIFLKVIENIRIFDFLKFSSFFPRENFYPLGLSISRHALSQIEFQTQVNQDGGKDGLRNSS